MTKLLEVNLTVLYAADCRSNRQLQKLRTMDCERMDEVRKQGLSCSKCPCFRTSFIRSQSGILGRLAPAETSTLVTRLNERSNRPPPGGRPLHHQCIGLVQPLVCMGQTAKRARITISARAVGYRVLLVSVVGVGGQLVYPAGQCLAGVGC